METLLEEYIENEKEMNIQKRKMIPLKKRQTELETEIVDYLKKKNMNGFTYKDYTFQIQNKQKVQTKKLSKRKEEVLSLLSQVHVNNDIVSKIEKSLSNNTDVIIEKMKYNKNDL